MFFRTALRLPFFFSFFFHWCSGFLFFCFFRFCCAFLDLGRDTPEKRAKRAFSNVNCNRQPCWEKKNNRKAAKSKEAFYRGPFLSKISLCDGRILLAWSHTNCKKMLSSQTNWPHQSIFFSPAHYRNELTFSRLIVCFDERMYKKNRKW